MLIRKESSTTLQILHEFTAGLYVNFWNHLPCRAGNLELLPALKSFHLPCKKNPSKNFWFHFFHCDKCMYPNPCVSCRFLCFLHFWRITFWGSWPVLIFLCFIPHSPAEVLSDNCWIYSNLRWSTVFANWSFIPAKSMTSCSSVGVRDMLPLLAALPPFLPTRIKHTFD